MVQKINNQFVFSNDEDDRLRRLGSYFPAHKSESVKSKSGKLKPRGRVLEDYIVRDSLISKSVYDCLTSDRILNRLVRHNLEISRDLISTIYDIKKKGFNKREKEYYAERKKLGKRLMYYPDARYLQSFGIRVLSPAKYGDKY